MSRPLIVILVILANVVLAVVAIVLLIAGPGRRLARKAIQPPEPGILQGQGLFVKTKFFTDLALGDVSEIRTGWPADQYNASLSIVGTNSADFIDADLQMRHRVSFSGCRAPLRIIKLDSNGHYGFLNRTEFLRCPAMLFNEKGEAAWAEGAHGGVLDSAAGNTSGSATGQHYSIAVGYAGFKGISLFNPTGGQIWNQKDTNVWHIEMLDINSDGRDEILLSDGAGRIEVRDTSGKFIADYSPGFPVVNFSLTRWGSEPAPAHILVPSQNPASFMNRVIAVLDSRGQKVAELPSPENTKFNTAYATPVNFGDGADDFAVIVGSNMRKDSMLLIYDQHAKIVYQEVFGSLCEGINAIPSKNGQQLLLGCKGEIWSYSPQSAKPTGTQNSTKPALTPKLK